MKKVAIAFMVGAFLMVSGQVMADEIAKPVYTKTVKAETLNDLNYERSDLTGEKEHLLVVIEAMEDDNSEVLEKIAVTDQDWVKAPMKSRVINNLELISKSKKRIVAIDTKLSEVQNKISKLGHSE